ncbi:hypothetical protein A3B36_01230 [Candidatus Uhrbacteria bacterium RIFCSPLOWO2_01_FULL_55_36]|uniref:Cupin 2 conserved barrel domain-containing protein n=1 Tax=Candidatus Uhrbacteria bacterium RIFCSPLOWO2_01_FULL_55_36 TaxID=1802404 RepID=A0A1F7UZJ5_9BACT|nr:MAG: hypothetical protein A3B36_01230 [Candidatus Uhrbacteria bacterium RIFCSPLOWO2_01_FULL_55_36]
MSHIPQLKDAERLDLNGPIVYVASSNRLKSVGYLELPPGTEAARTHRPVEERLTQAEGESLVTTFDESGNPVLNQMSRGSELRIPAGVEHIHANPFGRVSITKWVFEGDVTEIIGGLRREAKRITEEKKA